MDTAVRTKPGGNKGERSQLRQMCKEDLETRPPPKAPPASRCVTRAVPGAAADDCEGLDALRATGRAWAGDSARRALEPA